MNPDLRLETTQKIILHILETHYTYNPKEFKSDDELYATKVAHYIHQNFVLKDNIEAIIGEDEPAAEAVYKAPNYKGTEDEFQAERNANEIAKSRNHLKAEQRARAKGVE